jgi:hypothetical protein
MKSEKIEAKDKTLLVVSPLYNKMDKLYPLNNLITEKHIVIFLGDICFPFERYSDIPQRVNAMTLFMEGKNCFYIIGDKDFTYMKKALNTHADACDWLGAQHLAVRFTFENNTSALIVHGGVLPKHTTWSEVNNDIEVSFIADLPEVKKPWHCAYNGRFGYILSAHTALEDNLKQKYKHSISLDTKAFESNIIAVQEFSANGVGETIYI